jgi:rubrerythrin
VVSVRDDAESGAREAALRRALWDSFAAESQARERYAVYAVRAESQGYPQIARLLRAVTRAEELHAQRQLKAVRGVAGVAENLAAALKAEAEDVRRYAEARALAHAVGNRRAEQAFEFAEGVDRVHGRLLGQALTAAEAGRDLEEQPYLLCKVCGYLEVGERPPESCPVCGSPAVVFSPVD